MKKATTLDKLSELITDARIVSVVPNSDTEGIFTLRLRKGKKNFEVRVFATDLGWWFKKAGNTK